MQQITLKNFRFLVEREGGHTQIVTVRGTCKDDAMFVVCQASPGKSVESYTTKLASELGATEHERTYPGTRYRHGTAADPATWAEGDIIEDARGGRALVTGTLDRATGGLNLAHLAPGERHDGHAFSLHVLALTNTYSYQKSGSACPDELPVRFERAAPSSMDEDTAAEIRAMLEGA
jgi:hypothetical protein